MSLNYIVPILFNILVMRFKINSNNTSTGKYNLRKWQFDSDNLYIPYWGLVLIIEIYFEIFAIPFDAVFDDVFW